MLEEEIVRTYLHIHLEEEVAEVVSLPTEEAISLTKHAEKVGANGALIVTPYYNKPTQEGL